jgi:hypothetical protein
MRAWIAIALALGGSCWLAGAAAQEADDAAVPDLDFLEYLGAWAGEDDEWLAIEEWRKGNPEDDGEAADDEDAERKDEDDARE